MSDDQRLTTTCPHGVRHPVVCPQCEPEVYERARPQAERMAREVEARRTAAGTTAQTKDKLDLYVAQRLREHVDIAIVHESDDDGCMKATLRENGEHAIWRTVQEAIQEAGWRLAP